jgi:hypothetical protein
MQLLKLIVGILVLASFTSFYFIISPTEEVELLIDIPAITLTSSYTMNGEPFPESQYTRAFFSLRNSYSDDTAVLGDSNDQYHSTLIIPGVYDVVYVHTIGTEIPQNKDAVVMSDVAIQTDQDLDIDVYSVEISPHFTLNGKPFSTSVYNSAEFYLEDVSDGERIPLGNSHQASGPILILPGVYNVIYSHQNGSNVPQNQDAIVKAAVTIDVDQVLEVDVPAVTLTSTYTINGEPFPVSQYTTTLFSLRNPDSGDTVELGYSHDQYHSTMVISGVYDVVYAHTRGTEIPQNKDAVVMSGIDISSRRALPIDVPTVTLTSSYSLDGEPFPESQYTKAFFSLRTPGSGDTVALGDSNDQSHSTVVIPGVYDVVYEHTQGSGIPQNKDAVVMSGVDISSSQDLVIDVPAVTLTSSYTMNGEPFPISQYVRAFFSLRNPDSDDTVALGDSNDQSHSTLIIPGVYDVVYAHTQGSEIPQNKDAIVMSVVDISSSQDLAIDVPAVTLTSSYSLDGEPFPESQYTKAFFSLRTPGSGDTVALGDSNDQSHSTVVIPGVYDVVYTHTQGSEIPQNKDAIVMSVVNVNSS